MVTHELSPCKTLKWDTDFFGFHVAQVLSNQLTEESLHSIDAWCRQNDVSCLYFLSCSDDARTIRLAEASSFKMVDIRITFDAENPFKANTNINRSKKIYLRHAQREDVDFLVTIARESHHDSRFYYDQYFPSHLSDALYGAWIKQSCAGYADAVLVAELKHLPIGYISCHIGEGSHAEYDPIGRIGLIGVSRMEQGKGIGHLLLTNALEWFENHEVQKVRVVTQGRNRAAQRLYQRCGFLTQAVELWYHKWYKIPEVSHERLSNPLQ